MNSEGKLSTSVWYMRFFAVVAIICAHTPYAKDTLAPEFVIRFIDSFSNSGVAIFFFVSGIYYRSCGIKNRVQKLFSLVIPWVLFGSITYIIGNLQNSSIYTYIKWILGFGSYLWFMVVYVVILLLAEIIGLEKRIVLQYVLLVITIASRVLVSVVETKAEFAFVNPLNWVGFFTFGLIFSDLMKNKPRNPQSLKLMFLCTLLIISLLVVDICLESKLGYFGITSVFSQFLWIFLIMSISYFLSDFKTIFVRVGKNSLPIYLIHVSIVQFICNRIPNSVYIYLPLSVLFALFIWSLCFLGMRLAEKIKLRKLFCTLTGFK